MSALDAVRIVLVRPRGAANVGAAARAMKNMGVRDLALVRPEFDNGLVARALAVHAADVLAEARVSASLPEAVADCALVVGTTVRGGGYRVDPATPRAAAADLLAVAAHNRVALVFGPEDHGLSNDDLAVCQRLITIPAAAAYPSLNVAQAVLVCCYELLVASGTTPAAPGRELASSARREFMFRRLRKALLSIGFLDPANPDHIMFALRRVVGQALLDERDVRIGLALARQIEWAARRAGGAGGPVETEG